MGSRGPIHGAANGGRPADLDRRELTAKTGGRLKPSVQATRATKGSSVAPFVASAGVVPDPPADLGPAGSAVWSVVWSRASRWVDTELDAGVVRVLADCFDQRELFRRDLTERGPVVDVPVIYHGEVVAHTPTANPSEAMLRRVEARIDRLWQVLGIAPANRARLGLEIGRLMNQQDGAAILAARNRKAR